jgi:hypothetical protein
MRVQIKDQGVQKCNSIVTYLVLNDARHNFKISSKLFRLFYHLNKIFKNITSIFFN